MKVRRNEQGFLLIAVLVIVMLASMVALSLLFRMRAEQASFSAAVGSEQAWHAAMSGIQQAMHLARSADPAEWQNNPGALQHQFVLDDGADKWYFTVFAAAPPEESELRYGLIDENRKLNLNKAKPEMLQQSTFLAPTQIEAICGTSANPEMLASETGLPPGTRPYFSTLDELLKLPGFSPGVIYGEDANHNLRLDPNEDDGELLHPPDDSDGQLFLGLQEVATVYSYEYDIAEDRSARFQLNSAAREIPENLFPEKTAAFIEAAWSNNVVFKHPVDLLEAKLTFGGTEIDSGVGARELPLILDQTTTSFESRLIGRININTAPVKVLRTVPGIGEKAESIAQHRESLMPEQKQSVAWLFADGVLTAEEFRQAAPHITTRSLQFRFHVLGYSLPAGRYRSFEVVIDTADKVPQIIYLRDMTRLGLPFALPAEEVTIDVQTQS